MLENNTIWRCYPDMNKNFIPKEFRYDKQYPNPRNVILNIMKLVQITYKIDNPKRLYYYNKKFNYNSMWEQITKKSSNILLNDVFSKLNIKKSSNILDLGCGKNKILKLFKNNSIQYKNYYGIDFDISNLLLNIKSSFRNVTYNHLDLSKNWDNQDSWTIVDKKINYDYIFIINSLMHFNTDIFWDQLNNILNLNTKIILNILNDKVNTKFEFDKSYIYKKENKVYYYFDPIHLHEMNEDFIFQEELFKKIKKYNLKIDYNWTYDDNIHSLYDWYIISKI